MAVTSSGENSEKQPRLPVVGVPAAASSAEASTAMSEVSPANACAMSRIETNRYY